MIKAFVNSKIFDNSLIITVVLNTIMLALNGFLSKEQEKTTDVIQDVCTYIFIAEMGLKAHRTRTNGYPVYKPTLLQ